MVKIIETAPLSSFLFGRLFGLEDPLHGEEAGGEGEGEVLHFGEEVQDGVAVGGGPEFIQWDAGGGDGLDAEAGVVEEVGGGVFGEELEVSAVEDAAVHFGEMAEKATEQKTG